MLYYKQIFVVWCMIYCNHNKFTKIWLCSLCILLMWTHTLINCNFVVVELTVYVLYLCFLYLFPTRTLSVFTFNILDDNTAKTYIIHLKNIQISLTLTVKYDYKKYEFDRKYIQSHVSTYIYTGTYIVEVVTVDDHDELLLTHSPPIKCTVSVHWWSSRHVHVLSKNTRVITNNHLTVSQSPSPALHPSSRSDALQ